MKLITNEQRRRLLANGRWNAAREERDDLKPVVRLFCPSSGATWLLTEIDPERPDIAFGLCDIGVGLPKLDSVSLSDLASVASSDGLRIERDCRFRPTKTLQGYIDEAARLRRVKPEGGAP